MSRWCLFQSLMIVFLSLNSILDIFFKSEALYAVVFV